MQNFGGTSKEFYGIFESGTIEKSPTKWCHDETNIHSNKHLLCCEHKTYQNQTVYHYTVNQEKKLLSFLDKDCQISQSIKKVIILKRMTQ